MNAPANAIATAQPNASCVWSVHAKRREEKRREGKRREDTTREGKGRELTTRVETHPFSSLTYPRPSRASMDGRAA